MLFRKNGYRMFSEQLIKKPKMEVSLRSPYKTYLNGITSFSRIITKTNHSTLCIQNKMPPSVYILPPGNLSIKLTEEVKDFSGEIFHTGGWLVVHPDNTVDIDLMDIFEKDELSIEGIEKTETPVVENTIADKYADKIRKKTKKLFLKKLI